MLIKNIRIHRSDKKLLSHQLRLQLEVLKECILMFEQGDSCIEIIKRIQSVESAFSAANAQLLNIHLTKCLAALSNLESVDEALHEISGLYVWINCQKMLLPRFDNITRRFSRL